MKGIIFERAGAEPQVTDNLEKPKPSSDQLLVRSIYTAINPIDLYMSSTGKDVADWPLVLGCDAAGSVVEVGDNAQGHFKEGDEVFGCTRLGQKGHSTAQEFFLMDVSSTIHKPKTISLQEAATLGAGTFIAALGLINGLRVPVSCLEESLEAKDDGAADLPRKDWIVILGGATSVGQYAIQISVATGYLVAASCSADTVELVKGLGAVPFHDKKTVEYQVKEVNSITSNKSFRIFDANDSSSGSDETGDNNESNNLTLAGGIFTTLPEEETKYYTTSAVVGEIGPIFASSNNDDKNIDNKTDSGDNKNSDEKDSTNNDNSDSDKDKNETSNTEQNNEQNDDSNNNGNGKSNDDDNNDKTKDDNSSNTTTTTTTITTPTTKTTPIKNLLTHKIDLVDFLNQANSPPSPSTSPSPSSLSTILLSMIEKGRLTANAYDIVGRDGDDMTDVIEAWRYFKCGAGGQNKVLVKVG